MGTVENPPVRLVDGVRLDVYNGAQFEPVGFGAEIFIPAQMFLTHTGSGALTGTAAGSNGYPGWALDTTSDETLSTVLMLPDGWKAFKCDIIWSNASTGAGGVRWDVNFENPAMGSAASTGTTASVTATASTTQWALTQTEVIASSAAAGLTADRILRIRVNRDADHAGDTVANDASFNGILLTRVLA